MTRNDQGRVARKRVKITRAGTRQFMNMFVFSSRSVHELGVCGQPVHEQTIMNMFMFCSVHFKLGEHPTLVGRKDDHSPFTLDLTHYSVPACGIEVLHPRRARIQYSSSFVIEIIWPCTRVRL